MRNGAYLYRYAPLTVLRTPCQPAGGIFSCLFFRMAVLFGQLRDLAELPGDIAVAFPPVGQETGAAILDAVVRIPEASAAFVPQAVQRAVAEQRVFVIRPQMRPIPLFTQRHDKIDVYYQHGRSLAKACWPAICDWLHADILSAAAEFQEIPATNTCFTTQTALQIF